MSLQVNLTTSKSLHVVLEGIACVVPMLCILRFVSNFDRYARSRSGLFTRPSTGYVNLCFPSCHVNTRRYKLLYYVADNCLEKAEIYIYIYTHIFHIGSCVASLFL